MTTCSAHISPDSTLHTDWYNLFDSCEAASEIIFSIFDVDFVESYTFFCRFVFLFLCFGENGTDNLYYGSAAEIFERFIEVNQDAAPFRQCPLWRLPPFYLLCFHNVWSLLSTSSPSHLSFHSLCVPLDWLSLPRDARQSDMFRHTYALAHHAACSEPCLFFSTSHPFNKAWMKQLNRRVYTPSLPQHTHTCTHVQYAAALPASKLWLPSIIPPRCRVEWQLAAEEPWARHTLTRFCASLSGCYMWARKHVILTEGGGSRGVKDRWEM